MKTTTGYNFALGKTLLMQYTFVNILLNCHVTGKTFSVFFYACQVDISHASCLQYYQSY